MFLVLEICCMVISPKKVIFDMHSKIVELAFCLVVVETKFYEFLVPITG